MPRSRSTARRTRTNEANVIVRSFDFDADKDIILFVSAGQPGTYSIAKAPQRPLERRLRMMQSTGREGPVEGSQG
jgi:hypothetical protein